MKRPNPLNPAHMKPRERRSELCQLLALGLLRLHMRNRSQPSNENEEFRLHNPPDQSGHATTQIGENA